MHAATIQNGINNFVSNYPDKIFFETKARRTERLSLTEQITLYLNWFERYRHSFELKGSVIYNIPLSLFFHYLSIEFLQNNFIKGLSLIGKIKLHILK